MNSRQVFVVAVVLLLCVLLIAIGLWLAFLSTTNATWQSGANTPASSAPSGQPTAPRPIPPAATPPVYVESKPLSPQMLLGNPSNATTDPSNQDNFLMVKPYFCIAYNNSAGEPRWVNWRLVASDLGDAPRKRTFDPDTTLPDGFNVIVTRDYTRSGFDRGHMCDHSDRAATIESSYATFVMTNIVPQAPNNNRKAWAQLENYCRELARNQNDRLYITSGPLGRGGVGSNGFAETIADGRVVVPAETWKVIVVTPDTGRDDLSLISAGDRVIAVDVPNDDNKVGEEWDGFRCTPASIEQKTGLHFFTALPPEVRSALEGKKDSERIATPEPLVHGSGD